MKGQCLGEGWALLQLGKEAGMLDAWRDIHNFVDLDLYIFYDPSNIGSFELTAYPFPFIYFL